MAVQSTREELAKHQSTARVMSETEQSNLSETLIKELSYLREFGKNQWHINGSS